MSERAPYDLTAEQAVLAVCLNSEHARKQARMHLVGSDFYEPRHELLWDAIGRLDRTGKPVDPATVLTTVQHDSRIVALLPDLVTAPVVSENIAEYAAIVRGWSTRRAVWQAATKVSQEALSPATNPLGYASEVVGRFTAIRDSGVIDDTATRTLGEVLADPDDEPDWLIPGYLERRDRLMLTGDEGLGKSHLLRQFAICAAAGIDPWVPSQRIRPVKALIVDCENSERQVKAKARGMTDFATRYGKPDVTDRVFINCSRRLDLTKDRDLATLHREVDTWTPDLVVIGPLYRLIPRAIQTDDDAAPLLSALDTLRDRGCTLLIEAHAGHQIGRGGYRDMRPRGSSALLGWPEFGYGMRRLEANGFCEFSAWRGNRSEREWPAALRRDNEGVRWIPYDGPLDGARLGDAA